LLPGSSLASQAVSTTDCSCTHEEEKEYEETSFLMAGILESVIRSTQTSSGLMLNALWPASPMRLTLSSPVVILIPEFDN
jgi:hypothetical protein